MKNKAILIGNGFSSQLIPEYKNDILKKRLKNILPDLVGFLDTLWKNISFIFTNGEKYNFDPIFLYREYYGWDDVEEFIEPPYEVVVNELERYYKKFSKQMFLQYSISFHASSKVFDKYFSNYYSCLKYQIYNSEIISLEPYYSLAKMACELKLISPIQLESLERNIKQILRNEEKFTFANVKPECCLKEESVVPDCLEVKKRFKLNAETFFSQFKYIYTTNYDCLLEDLTNLEIRHLHGTFDFPKTSSRIKFKYDSKSNLGIVLGFDSKQKELELNQNGNLSIHYLNTLKSSQINELHIFGYSGINDQHINENFLKNTMIKKIVYYGNPKLIQDPLSEYNEHIQRWLGTYYCPYKREIIIKNRDEVWEQLYV